MKKIIVLVAAALFSWPLLLQADVFELMPQVILDLPDLPADWQATREAPTEMVAHIAEHVKEEAQQKNHTLTQEQALQLARKRLEREELILYSRDDKAHVVISFDARTQEQPVPGPEEVALSANYAASGVSDEGWQDVQTRFTEVAIEGADAAHRFTIRYTHEGKPGYFTGLVGYAEPFWFWVYGNDHSLDGAHREALDQILSGVKVQIQ